MVQNAINTYKNDNDWLTHFLDDCCEISKAYIEKSGVLYSEYRAFCLRTGEYVRSAADFYFALEAEGIMRKRSNKGVIVYGLHLVSEFLE
ncbi:hypothetical protein RsY01_2138 [Lactococcus reticulitermitis]|uniref:Uncharacterized protein n=1 Tax=Pseudolactococcus reticulitermitis TaxID=2025039 RepID=A0A224X3A9_9LACT|nr:hypothetical protein RsY01_2138 [Lactococcus reticulitermitis]